MTTMEEASSAEPLKDVKPEEYDLVTLGGDPHLSEIDAPQSITRGEAEPTPVQVRFALVFLSHFNSLLARSSTGPNRSRLWAQILRHG
jgi:hypothetical protein